MLLLKDFGRHANMRRIPKPFVHDSLPAPHLQTHAPAVHPHDPESVLRYTKICLEERFVHTHWRVLRHGNIVEAVRRAAQRGGGIVQGAAACGSSLGGPCVAGGSPTGARRAHEPLRCTERANQQSRPAVVAPSGTNPAPQPHTRHALVAKSDPMHNDQGETED
jgi:hypothetical protein